MSRRGWVVVLIVVALVLVGCGVLAKREWESLTYCSRPPDPQERAVQEAFVLARITDARGFEWDTMDCDDEGASTLTYTTALGPDAAIDIFRADPACARATWTNDPGVLTCMSGAVRVEVGFEQGSGARTDGYLGWVDRGVDP